MKTPLAAALVAALIPLSAVVFAADETGSKSEAKKKPVIYKVGSEITLKKHRNLNGEKDVDLAKMLATSKNGLVLAWHSPVCPTSKKIMPAFAKLRDKFKEKGWTFVSVFSGSNGPVKAIDPDQHRMYYKLQKLDMPVADDRDQIYKGPFQIKVTPTFAVIQKVKAEKGIKGILRYIGNLQEPRGEETPFVSLVLEHVAAGKKLPEWKSHRIRPFG